MSTRLFELVTEYDQMDQWIVKMNTEQFDQNVPYVFEELGFKPKAASFKEALNEYDLFVFAQIHRESANTIIEYLKEGGRNRALIVAEMLLDQDIGYDEGKIIYWIAAKRGYAFSVCDRLLKRACVIEEAVAGILSQAKQENDFLTLENIERDFKCSFITLDFDYAKYRVDVGPCYYEKYVNSMELVNYVLQKGTKPCLPLLVRHCLSKKWFFKNINSLQYHYDFFNHLCFSLLERGETECLKELVRLHPVK